MNFFLKIYQSALSLRSSCSPVAWKMHLHLHCLPVLSTVNLAIAIIPNDRQTKYIQHNLKRREMWLRVSHGKYATRFPDLVNECITSRWCNPVYVMFLVHFFILRIFSAQCNSPLTVDHPMQSIPIGFASRRLRLLFINKGRAVKDFQYRPY